MLCKDTTNIQLIKAIDIQCTCMSKPMSAQKTVKIALSIAWTQ